METTKAKLLEKRRRKLAKLMGSGVAYLTNPPPERDHSRKNKPDPDMFYLTGLTEPDCAYAMKVESGKIKHEAVYCRERNPTHEKWNGRTLGPKGAARVARIDDARPWKGLAKFIEDSFDNSFKSHCIRFDLSNEALLEFTKHIEKQHGKKEHALCELRHLTARIRMVKDSHEVDLIKKSSEITTNAMHKVALALHEAKSEADLEAIISHFYTENLAQHAFLPIVACGKNACTAHYVKNNSRLQKNKLVLVDTGAVLNGYASDLTRVFPVNGKFTNAQRDLYETVLEAQKAAIARAIKGNTMQTAHNAACKALAKGLASMGICRGSPAKVMASGDFTDFFFHSIGHMLGIEVHDPITNTDSQGKPLQLKPNMVVTIEPGLYLDDRKKVPVELRNTGVRIEDLVQVARNGNNILTDGAPKSIRDVEALLEWA